MTNELAFSDASVPEPPTANIRFQACTGDHVSAGQRILLMFGSAIMAVSAHVLFLLLLPQPWHKNQGSDYTAYYEPVAQSLAAGNGLYLRSKPALLYPPGIPLLYAATFWTSRKMDISPATGMRLLEGLFVIVSGVLVSVVSMRFFSWKVALLASALWSTYPFHLWLTKQPDPSTLFSVLLLASALLFFVWSAEGRNAGLYGVLLGLILGITALIKPFAIGLPVVFAALACICPITSHRRSRILFSSCILLVYALAVLPWEIWAWRVGGHWIPLCTNGANAAIDGLTFGTERGLPQVAMPKAARTLVADAAAHYPQLKSTSSIRRFVLTKVRESPGAVLELLLVKAGRSWFGNESHTFERWIAIVQLFYLPFIILGGRSVWKYGGTQQKWFFVVSIAMILYFWMMTTLVVFAILRYMVPVVCLLMVLVAVSLQVLATRVFHTKSGYRH